MGRGNVTATDNWGRTNQRLRAITPFREIRLMSGERPVLPFGNGRSYGDSCHCDEGTLLDARLRDRILSFDVETGRLQVQSGAMLGDVLNHLEGSGWFMPVVPGTRFVTMGGMLANDIHGKNHEHHGTFGRHVRGFSLVRSDRGTLSCSADENTDLFAATVGGMGLTGFVTELDIQLIRVPGSAIRERVTPFANVEEALAAMDADDSTYSVAWLDSLSTGKRLGQGLLMTGEHTAGPKVTFAAKPKLSIPFTPPTALVRGWPLRAFNAAYLAAGRRTAGATRTVSPASYFFPLDAIGGWNRLYGPRGLHQHQCVLPMDGAAANVERLIKTAQDAGHGSFLTVLKRFGGMPSPGLVSFPQKGVTLTLDFANRGPKTLALLDRLDAIVMDAGGRTNAYKDTRMAGATYRAGQPDWARVEALRDPSMGSNFWNRVLSDAPQASENRNINHIGKPRVETARRKVSA